MPKPSQTARPAMPGASDINLLAWLATCISVFAFLFYYRQGEILLYGDAIAHINIARRVFDSRTPGLLQLGTVWLPLPHLLMIPFIISTGMWRSGAGGSIPSMAGYVFAVAGVFRLTRTTLTDSAEDRHTRIAAWIAAAIFGANPNLIYMQSTAMGETLYLAFFTWAVVFFADWIRGLNSLTKCALCIAAASLVRYDGWFLTATMTIAVLAISVRLRRRHPLSDQSHERTTTDANQHRGVSTTEDRKNRGRAAAEEGQNRGKATTEADQNRGRTITEDKKSRGRAALQGRVRGNSTRGALAPVKFVLIVAAAPALWLAYNRIVYRNPLEFANGPYSAKAIEKKTQSAGNPGHPGSDHPAVAALYYLKSAENNVAQPEWLQRTWMLLGIAAVLVITFRFRRALPLLFLLVPIPFYALSIAYGGVPIFIPNWWPFTHYNARYGLQLLPALAIAIAFLTYLAVRAEALPARVRPGIALLGLAVVGVSYASIWRSEPICLKEAQVNMRTRNQLQVEVARWLEKLPPDATILMYLGDQVGALERAAVPLKRTINEGNHRVWKQPADREGLWERALADPAKYADYVLAFDGDPVWQAVHDRRLHELVELHVSGQPRAVLYAAR